MTSENTGYDILDQYRFISNKLKKRFLRKPNETEASEAFAALGLQCESQNLSSYAGLCWIAAARCEGTLGNNVSETSNLLRSARQFLIAEESDINSGCNSVPSENLQSSLSCYTHAATRYPENSVIPVGLDLEIIDFLKRIGRTEFLEVYLQSAIELSKEDTDTNIHCLDLLASYLISKGDYVSALHTYQEISKRLENVSNNGARCEVLLRSEISSVFLLLILRPSLQNVSASLTRVLEKYTWGDQNDPALRACHMSERLFLLMQSLVLICQSLDTSSLEGLELEFWPFLTTEQKDLLRILIKIYYP